jgi:hypothetical protein
MRRAVDIYDGNGGFGEEFERYLDFLFELRFVKEMILFVFSTSGEHEVTLYRQKATIEFEERARNRYRLDILRDAEEKLEEEIDYWACDAPWAQTNSPGNCGCGNLHGPRLHLCEMLLVKSSTDPAII